MVTLLLATLSNTNPPSFDLLPLVAEKHKVLNKKELPKDPNKLLSN